MEILTEFIGWLGAACFAICALPQAWLSYRQKHSKGVSSAFIALWLNGELLSLAYVILQDNLLWPLVVNYLLNLAFLLVIIYFKIKPGP